MTMRSVDRLTVLSLLVAGQSLVHLETFASPVFFPDPLWYLQGLALVALLLRPRSLAVLTAALVLNLVVSWRHLPYEANHLLFEDVVNLMLLTAIVVVLVQQVRSGEGWRSMGEVATRDRVYARFAPPARVGLLLLYVFVTFAKLNRDFLDPEVSCGAVMLRETAETWFGADLPRWMEQAAIYGTLVGEGGLPVLLFFRRTRALALALGLLFHLTLALHPAHGIYSFTSLMFLMYFLFTGDGFLDTLNRYLARAAEVLAAPRARLLAAAAAVVVLVWCALVVTGVLPQVGTKRYLIWLPAGFAFVGAALFLLWRTPAGQRAVQQAAFSVRGVHWAFVVLIVANAVMPYVGLKTQTSFAMFSNLRTEDGTSNHLLVPTSWQVADYQRGLVRVTGSDHPLFQAVVERGELLTRFEFERMLELHDEFEVTCECYGTTLEITKVEGEITGFDQERSYSPPTGRWMHFRPVTDGDRMRCSH